MGSGSTLRARLIVIGLTAFTLVGTALAWAAADGGAAEAAGKVLPWVVLLAGAAVTTLAYAVLGQGARRIAFAEAEVETRTRELRGALEDLAEANSALAAAQADAERMSRTDAVTGAYNRRYAVDLLEGELGRAERGHTAPGLLLVEVDYLRAIEEAHGPEVADGALTAACDRVRSVVRPYDAVCRFGDATLLIVAAEMPDESSLARLAETIRAVIGAGPVAMDDAELWLTASAGGVLAEAGDQPLTLLAEVDSALASARRAGRDRAVVGEAEVDRLESGPEPLRIARALAVTGDQRRGLPDGHADRVAGLAARTAESLGLAPDQVAACRLGGYLHDLGLAGVPDAVLRKRSALDDQDWAQMRTHVEIGSDIVARLPGLEAAADAVRHHHERYDGTGYPDGLAAQAIPIEARVVSVADAYCAMTIDTLWRGAKGRRHAVDELRACASTQFDADVVEAFVRVLEERDARRAA